MIEQEQESALSTPQDAVDSLFALLAAHGGSRATGTAVATGLTGRVSDLSGPEMVVLAAALSSRYSDALNQIWQRADANAARVSEEDWALAKELSYQALRAGVEGDAVALTVERIMRAGPYRAKWDEARGAVSWLAQDIANALQTVKDRLQVSAEKCPDFDISDLPSADGKGPDTSCSPMPTGMPWPTPVAVLGLPPAPALDPALLPPEIANATLDASERLQCPPDYVAWGLVTTIAGLIGRGVGVAPLSILLIVGEANPARFASSTWVHPRRSRAARTRRPTVDTLSPPPHAFPYANRSAPFACLHNISPSRFITMGCR